MSKICSEGDGQILLSRMNLGVWSIIGHIHLCVLLRNFLPLSNVKFAAVLKTSTSPSGAWTKAQSYMWHDTETFAISKQVLTYQIIKWRREKLPLLQANQSDGLLTY